MKSITRAMFLLALTVCTLGLSACNTMEGAGKDVSATGRAVSNTAEETKQGL